MNRPSTPAAEPSDTDRLLQIVRQLAHEAYPEREFPVSLDSLLEEDLAFDSLTRVELVHRVGDAFGCALPDAALTEARTPRDLLQLLSRLEALAAPLPVATLGGASDIEAPAQAATLMEALTWHVERQAERVHVLLYSEDQSTAQLTYGALEQRARAIASGLIQHGLLPGRAVALMLPTGFDYLESFFGVMLAGGIPVPIYPPARLAQLQEHLRRHTRLLSNAQAVLMITVPEAKQVGAMLRSAVTSLADIVTPNQLRAQPIPLPAPAQAGDLAFLQYTSGSTGDPKGVMLTHANLLANIRAMGKAARASSADVMVSWLPLYHDMGLIGAWFGSLYHGMPLVLMPPTSFLARPARWLQAISRHRGTISGGPNFAYELCSARIAAAELDGVELSSWRFAFNGAEPVNPAALAAFANRFASHGLRSEALTPVYGLAECSVGLAFGPLLRGPRIDVIRREPLLRHGRAEPAPAGESDTVSIPACGRALPGHEIRIVNAAGFELPERRVGRLEFCGPSATSGYYRNQEGTRKLLHDGWLDSGDHAYLADGEVHITGRAKDLILRGGRNLYPYDLEQEIGQLPGIRKGCVAVFAATAADGAERVVALAETRLGDTDEQRQLRRTIEQLAVEAWGAALDEVVLAPPGTVLKTSSGKIRHSACRDAYERGRLLGRQWPAWLQMAWLAAGALSDYCRVGWQKTQAWGYALYAWSVVALLGLPAVVLAAALQRPRLGWPIVQAPLRLLRVLTALPVSTQGIERLPTTPHVLVVNHGSYLDGPLLTAALPAKARYCFIAKRELQQAPLVGALLRGLGAIFVERFEAQQGAAEVKALEDVLRAGHSLVVFPEGTFTRAPGLREFHLGAFLAAAQAGVPLVVGALRGTRAVLRDESWLPHRRPVVIEIGPTLLPSGNDWQAAVRLRDEARQAMLPLCGEFDARR